MVKNRIFGKAAANIASDKKDVVKFAESLRGANMLLFTGMDPYSLVLLLRKSKVKVSAKAGDIATNDIVVPAGNTGLPPGPIISEFNEADVPTRIESGSIWVARDTLVAGRNEVVSPKVATLLTKLGIKPIEASISLASAYEDGSILGSDYLRLDVEGITEDFRKAAASGLSLALNANYLIPETAPYIFGKAFREALAIGVEAEYLTPETISSIVQRAYGEAQFLSAKIQPIEKPASNKEVKREKA